MKERNAKYFGLSLSNANLKYIGSIAMLLDHIWFYFPEQTPILFHWIGRIAAPLFLFCLAEGMRHTKNRNLYLCRLLGMNLLMIILCEFFHLEQNFIGDLFQTALLIDLYITWKENESCRKWKLVIYLLSQILSASIIIFCAEMLEGLSNELHLFVSLLCCSSLIITEGGILFVLLGVCYYFANKQTVWILTITSLFVVVYYLLHYTPCASVAITYTAILLGRPIAIFFQITLHYFFHYYGWKQLTNISIFSLECQWMMIFSFIPICFYQGEHGKQNKWLFYFFYPAHLVLLSVLR